MAQIPRPPKQGAVTTYVAKVAAGYPRILAGEMDADLDTIYAAWNGGADTVNLKNNAVTSEKIAPDAVGPRELVDGAVDTAQLHDLAVTTAKLHDGAVTDAKVTSVGWSKVTGVPAGLPPGGTAGGDLAGSYPNPTIRPGAVTPASIAPGTLTGATLAAGAIGTRELADGGVATGDLADLAVSRAKIAIGNALQWHTGQSRGDTLELLTLNVERGYLEYTWPSRGGPFVVIASLHCAMGIDASSPIPELNIRLRLDSAAGAVNGTLLQELGAREMNAGATQITIPVTLTVGYVGKDLTATTHRITVSAVPLIKYVGWVRIASGWSVLAEWA